MQNSEIDLILKEYGLSETELIFKTNVKRLRESQADPPTLVKMAEHLGMTYGTYRLIESLSPVNVKFSTMERIAKYYGISVSKLFDVNLFQENRTLK